MTEQTVIAKRASLELSAAGVALQGARAIFDVLQHFASCGKLNEIDVYALCKIGSDQAAVYSDRASEESDFFDDQADDEKPEVRNV